MLEIFLVQMEVAPNDKAKNFAKVEALTQGIRKETQAGTANAGLIVLPEMFATGYLPLHPESAAEVFTHESSGETAQFLYKLANRTGCAVMGAGISGADDASGVSTTTHCNVRTAPLANHASVYMPGNAAEYAGYDKRRPFFMEQGKFRAGADVNLFKIDEWTVAPTICFDLRFPELYRDAVKAGRMAARKDTPLEHIAQGPRHREPGVCRRSELRFARWKVHRKFTNNQPARRGHRAGRSG